MVAGTCATFAPFPAQGQSPAPATEPAAAATQPGWLTPVQYVDRLSNDLATGNAEQRYGAALRLIEIGTPEAALAIGRALTGTDERAQRAAARAIADRAATDPGWVVPLSQLLGREKTISEAAARALSHYDGDARAYDPLIRLARSRQQPSRLAVIRAMGRVVQKPVAETLVGIVTDSTEDAPIRVAAGEALQTLGGVPVNGSDSRLWSAWWAARQADSPLVWRTRVLAEQHAWIESDDDRAREQVRQFKASVRRLLLNQYTVAPAQDRARIWLSFLNDPDADVREIGASILPEAVQSGYPITDEVHRRLIDLVSDPSAEVRLQAVQSVTALADPNALDPILTQIQVESNPQVKVSLLRAVGQPGIGSVRALGVLEQALREVSPETAAAAAGAIRSLAPEIRTNSGEARDLSAVLQDALQQRTGPPGEPNNDAGSVELRDALIGAVAALSGPDAPDSLVNWFNGLLSQNESPRARRAALEGLAGLGERSADIIAHQLQLDAEPDPAVRQAAATALGAVKSFGYAAQLDRSSQPQHEPDPHVREAAWKALQSLFPLKTTTARELRDYADLFERRKEVEHEVAALRELERKLETDGDAQSLAITRQREGEAYLQLHEPSEAVPSLRQALAFWEARQAQSETIVNLVNKLMAALLQSGQYHDAVKFGEQEIRRDPTNQTEVGPDLWHEAERLIKKGDPTSLKDAATLIQESLSMSPPLDETFRDQLSGLRQNLPAPTTTPG